MFLSTRRRRVGLAVHPLLDSAGEAAGTMGLTGNSRNLARFSKLFEVPQIFNHGLARTALRG